MSELESNSSERLFSLQKLRMSYFPDEIESCIQVLKKQNAQTTDLILVKISIHF